MHEFRVSVREKRFENFHERKKKSLENNEVNQKKGTKYRIYIMKDWINFDRKMCIFDHFQCNKRKKCKQKNNISGGGWEC